MSSELVERLRGMASVCSQPDVMRNAANELAVATDDARNKAREVTLETLNGSADELSRLSAENTRLNGELERWRTLHGADDVEDSIRQDARGKEGRLLNDRLRQIRELEVELARLRSIAEPLEELLDKTSALIGSECGTANISVYCFGSDGMLVRSIAPTLAEALAAAKAAMK